MGQPVAMWDAVTLGMILRAMLHQKLIDLRHKCLFYLGHVPTFLDMLLSALGEPNTDRLSCKVFVLGIGSWNPYLFYSAVSTRTSTIRDTVTYGRATAYIQHSRTRTPMQLHSEVHTKDEDWPTLEEIIAFRDRVRAWLLRVYDDFESGKRKLTRRIVRTLVMTVRARGLPRRGQFFHLATPMQLPTRFPDFTIYAHSARGHGTLPPPGFPAPPSDALSKQWSTISPPAMPTVALGPAQAAPRHDGPESADFLPEHAHGAVAQDP